MIELEKVGPDAAPGPGGASVLYRSRGAVLVIGDDARVLPAACQVAEHQRVLAFAPGLQPPGRLPRKLRVVGGRIVALHGHLGRFRAYGAVPDGGRRDIAPDVPPPGYFAPRGEGEVDEALHQIARLVGDFRKPRYFDLDPSLCAHAAQGLTGCRRCIDACDAAAIRSAGASIAIDPYLCQGCAGCALVCPTGAVRFASRAADRPPVEGGVLGLRGSRGRAGLPDDDVLVIHAASAALPAAALNGARCMAVGSMAAVGEEVWLTALAAGTRAVVLVEVAGMPGRTRAAFESHVGLARSMLEACGGDPRRIVACAAGQLQATLAALPPRAPAPHAAGPAPAALPATKRAMTVAALAVLGSGATAPAVALAPGAPFGAVEVNGPSCTVRMACTHLCPTGALLADDQAPLRLLFVESACVQCGLCVAGCPERAIALVPRLDAPAMAATGARVVAEDRQVECADCGQPFLGQRQLQRSAQILSALPDPDGGLARMLNRCMACRARAAL